jgi:2-polyprenyl-6-methoxyphenol hydroxylase-like FAD-dependent oxidoreductase
VHASTLTLIDELGLWPQVSGLPFVPLRQVRVLLDGGSVPVADFTRLRVPHPLLAMVPQWHFLTMLADAGRAEPTVTLRMQTEVTDLLWGGGSGGGGPLPHRQQENVHGGRRARGGRR